MLSLSPTDDRYDTERKVIWKALKPILKFYPLTKCILIKTFFCCKCQKTQPHLALELLAQVPEEPKGETGFRAGLPIGAQRVLLRPSFSPSLNPVSSVTTQFSGWLT